MVVVCPLCWTFSMLCVFGFLSFPVISGLPGYASPAASAASPRNSCPSRDILSSLSAFTIYPLSAVVLCGLNAFLGVSGLGASTPPPHPLAASSPAAATPYTPLALRSPSFSNESPTRSGVCYMFTLNTNVFEGRLRQRLLVFAPLVTLSSRET